MHATGGNIGKEKKHGNTEARYLEEKKSPWKETGTHQLRHLLIVSGCPVHRGHMVFGAGHGKFFQKWVTLGAATV